MEKQTFELNSSSQAEDSDTIFTRIIIILYTKQN